MANTFNLTRQQLYDLVWSKPISKLAPRFGISDQGLRKRCKTLLIPVPPRGYWAKKAVGKRAKQTKLPPAVNIGSGHDQGELVADRAYIPARPAVSKKELRDRQVHFLEGLIRKTDKIEGVRRFLAVARAPGCDTPRYAAFVAWVETYLAELEAEMGPERIEPNLALDGLFRLDK